MKVLHLNTLSTGGAALCAIRINKALESHGIDSRMLFAQGKTVPEGIKGAIVQKDKNLWDANRVTRFAKRLLIQTPFYRQDKVRMERRMALINNQEEKPLYLHSPYSDYKNIVHHPLFEWADIIQLHWVADFIDFPTFFKEIKKPIVWRLPDKYPAVGVQHYCSEFHPIPENLIPIDTCCRKIKRESVLQAKNLRLVAISKEMYNLCVTSDVLKGFPISLINNGVDTTLFRIYNREDCRKELCLASDTVVFLFSSYWINDCNKGIERVIHALDRLDVKNKILICIGNLVGSLPESSFPILLTGHIKNQTKIAKFYSAADFFIQSSYEESFGQTVLEAMACGTPVISTPSGISPDVIRPFNGFLCDGFDSDAILDGINEAMSRHYDSSAIRQYIVDNYQYSIIAKQYIELYKKILAEADSNA